MLVDWFLDPALVFSGGPVVSTEPLLINTPGALALRPEATTSIPDLFLASDCVRCDVDLATMEGDHEAARAAANASHDASGGSEPHAPTGKRVEGPVFTGEKQHDYAHERHGSRTVTAPGPKGRP